jgi:hypothetical protein
MPNSKFECSREAQEVLRFVLLHSWYRFLWWCGLCCFIGLLSFPTGAWCCSVVGLWCCPCQKFLVVGFQVRIILGLCLFKFFFRRINKLLPYYGDLYWNQSNVMVGRRTVNAYNNRPWGCSCKLVLIGSKRAASWFTHLEWQCASPQWGFELGWSERAEGREHSAIYRWEKLMDDVKLMSFCVSGLAETFAKNKLWIPLCLGSACQQLDQ